MPYDPLETLGRIDPEMRKHLREQDEFIFADGALSGKVKLLMAMAFDAAHGAEGGVRGLASRARKAGATNPEIGEALRVAFHMNGVGPLYIGSLGLKEAE